MSAHKYLKRLEYYKIDNPVFFITTCTHLRQPVLATQTIAAILVDEWKHAREKHGWIVGRYVVMPDHVHFFCVNENNIININGVQSLSKFMQQWKQWTSKRIIREILNIDSGQKNKENRIWQAGFFDHVLRSAESYNEKWKYVLMNPVRKGLVQKAGDWPFQGELFEIYL